MKSFKEILKENYKTHKYRIKLAIDELTYEMLETIESVCRKYNIVDLSKPVRTIIQRHPMDFYADFVSNVWIIDVELEYAVDSNTLIEELSRVLHIPKVRIIVRHREEGQEQIEDELRAKMDMDDYARDNEMKQDSILPDKEPYYFEPEVDGKMLFGNFFNMCLLKYFQKIRKENETYEFQKFFKDGPLFKFLKDKKNDYFDYKNNFIYDKDEFQKVRFDDKELENIDLNDFKKFMDEFLGKYGEVYSKKMWGRKYKKVEDPDYKEYLEIFLDVDDKVSKKKKENDK